MLYIRYYKINLSQFYLIYFQPNFFNMKSPLFFIFLCLYSFFSFSQETKKEDIELSLTNIGSSSVGCASNGFWIPAKTINNYVEGSVYLFPNFVGQYNVISKKGGESKLYNLNYNLNTKTLEARISKDSIFQYNLNEIDYVLNQKNKYKNIDDSQVNGLLLEIFNGKKLQMYKEFTTVVQEATFNPLTQAKIGNDTRVRMEYYYFHINGSFEKIKLNKKTTLKFLSDKQDLIKEFVSKNNLSFTSEEDIVIILTYYDSL